MKIAIIGYAGSGKSTLFHWMTGVPADASLAHTTQAANAPVWDLRLTALADIYQPKKVSHASLEVVDTPGLERDHQGNPHRLALMREAGCLVFVVGAFQGANASRDVQSLEEDLLLADLEIVTGRLERLRLSAKKPRPGRETDLADIQALEPVAAHLDQGRPLREMQLTPEQALAIKSFQLMTDKPRLVVENLPDDQPATPLDQDEGPVAFPVLLNRQLDDMDPAERSEFCRELGIHPVSRSTFMLRVMHASGQMLFFTVGPKEVRSWLIPQGSTAEQAAECIHTDLARGFVRAERMTVDDLIRLGSEREIKARNLMTKEAKGYIVQQGDVLHILSSV